MNIPHRVHISGTKNKARGAFPLNFPCWARFSPLKLSPLELPYLSSAKNQHQLPLVTSLKNMQPLFLIHDSRKGQRDAQKRHKKFKSAGVWHTNSSLLSCRVTPTHQSLLPKTEVQGLILSLSQEETGVKIFWLYKERQKGSVSQLHFRLDP